MIISEKSHQNLSDYSQFLLKKKFENNKKQIFSGEKMGNSGKYIYDYAPSFFVENFSIQCAILVNVERSHLRWAQKYEIFGLFFIPLRTFCVFWDKQNWRYFSGEGRGGLRIP